MQNLREIATKANLTYGLPLRFEGVNAHGVKTTWYAYTPRQLRMFWSQASHLVYTWRVVK